MKSSNGWTEMVQVPDLGKLGKLGELGQKNFGKPKMSDHSAQQI